MPPILPLMDLHRVFNRVLIRRPRAKRSIAAEAANLSSVDGYKN